MGYKNGVLVSDFCIADSRNEALKLLAKSLDPLLIVPTFASILVDLRSAVRDLHIMVNSGVRIADAFAFVARSGGAVGCVFDSVARDLIRGISLDQAVADHFGKIDPTLGSIMSVINSGKGWIRSLQQAIHYLDRKYRMSQLIRQALIYPILVLFVLVSVVWFQALFLFPGALYVVAIVVTGFLICLIGLFFGSENIYFGSDQIYAAYFQSLYCLVSAGMSIQDAVVVTSGHFNSEELKDIAKILLEGRGFKEALRNFPVIVRTMITNAEKSKGVGRACKYVGDFYSERVERKLMWIGSLFGPCILCVVGILLIGVVSTNVGIYKDLMMNELAY